MITVSRQHARIPIGNTADGTPVYVSTEWLNYLCVELFTRVGGSTELSSDEIRQLIELTSIGQATAGQVNALHSKVKREIEAIKTMAAFKPLDIALLERVKKAEKKIENMELMGAFV